MVEQGGGTRLSDGTAIADLVPRTGEQTVAARVMHDPEIYRLELERIFDRTWIFVAHESEIPNANDFVTRRIGQDPVIVTRGREGDFSVLLNSCSHRGPQVCLADRGSTPAFRCPYHGWVYRSNGTLIGVPGERQIYGERLDKEKHGLKRARVGVYQGMIFATWNEDAVPLEEHIGPLRIWLDVVFGFTKSGMEVAGPPQRWVIPANWKLGPDNFTVDNYHPAVVHEGLADTVPGIGLDVLATIARVVTYTDPKRGHSLAGFVQADDTMPKPAYLDIACQIGGIPRNVMDELREALSEEQVEMLLRSSAGAGNIWPNLSWIRSGFVSARDEPAQAALSIRYWQPMGPDKVEVFSWTLVHKDAPEDVKRASSAAMARSFGSSGNFESDDAEVWINTQKGTSGVQGAKRKLLYTAAGNRAEGEAGEIYTYPHQITDTPQWNFYARWRDMLEG